MTGEPEERALALLAAEEAIERADAFWRAGRYLASYEARKEAERHFRAAAELQQEQEG